MDETTIYDVLIEQPVDAARIQKFDAALRKYKSGKTKLERRVIAAEQWWKLRNCDEEIRSGVLGPDESAFRAKSGWLHNVIVAKHADAMDNYPEPIILPREQSDEEQAKTLSAVLPVVLEQTGFKRTYWDCWWQKLKPGTGVYKVTWDQRKQNGRGDISIEKVNILHIFWEPGISDVQRSRYFFHVDLVDNDVLEEEYPQLKDKLGGTTFTLSKFLYDDHVDTTDKSVVVDVYYKKAGALHFCKYVNDQILASTENDGAPLYDHGKYPFVFDALWPIEGSPCGYGFVDLCANPQMYLDMMDTAFLKNTMVGATPRYFQRIDGGINEAEFLDLRKPIVHVNASTLDENAMRVIDYKPLSGTYMNVYNGKITELRETSGNTETANGITAGGVTAASAIAALQEASGKTSRDATQASYMAYSDIIDLCIELIRQFYDMPRTFRITGDQGQTQFTTINNAPMLPQEMSVGDVTLGYRLPVYDVRVEVQKQNAYNRTAQNELAIQLFQLGMFAPEMATPALQCLDMMDFEGKDELMQKISLNGTLQQKLMETQQIALALAQKVDPALAAQIAASMGMDGAPMPAGGPVEAPAQGESGVTAKARARTAGATEVRA